MLGHVSMMMLVDNSNFFARAVLLVPPDASLVIYRVIVWTWVATGATQEYYEWVMNKYVIRPGPFVWIALFMLSMEYTLIIQHHYSKPLDF